MSAALRVPARMYPVDHSITFEDVLFLLPAIEHLVGRVDSPLRFEEDDFSCPVCALAHAFGVGLGYTVAFSDAAEELGLPWKVARDIASAADLVGHSRRAELEAYLR